MIHFTPIFRGFNQKKCQTRICWNPQDGPLLVTNGVTTLIDDHYKVVTRVYFTATNRVIPPYLFQLVILEPTLHQWKLDSQAQSLSWAWSNKCTALRSPQHQWRPRHVAWRKVAGVELPGSRAMSNKNGSFQQEKRQVECARNFTLWLDVVDFLNSVSRSKSWLMSVSGFFYINGPLKMRYWIYKNSKKWTCLLAFISSELRNILPKTCLLHCSMISMSLSMFEQKLH